MDYNKCNYYTCLHCGKSVHKTHKYMHDLKCHESKKKTINNKNNINNNNNKYNNKHKNNNSNKNQIIYNYKCEICGIIMNLKEKSDHLFCHEIEKNEMNEKYNNINVENEKKEKEEIKVNDILNFSFNDGEMSLDINKNNFNNNINNNRNNNINNNRNERNSLIYNLLNRNNNRNNIINNNNNLNIRRRRRNSMDYNRATIFNFNSSSSLSSGYNSGSNSRSDSLDIYHNDEAHIDDIINRNCVISKIKKTHKLSEDKKKCLICLEKFKKGDNIIILPCIHIFHSDCIKNWMKKQVLCPLCKCAIDNKKK